MVVGARSMPRHGWAIVLVALAIGGCSSGDGTSASTRADTFDAGSGGHADGGSGAASGGRGPASGGAPSGVGDGGASSSGGAASTSDAGTPPPVPFGAPGWRDSTKLFCPEILGHAAESILSTPDAVYLLMDSSCNTLGPAGCDPPHPAENEILYVNDGKGWRTLFRRAGGDGKIVGFMDGGVVIVGSGDCTVMHVTDGGARCLDAGMDAGAPHFTTGAVASDGSLILLGATDFESGKTALVRYDGTTWTTLTTWAGEEPYDLALHGTRAFIAGKSQFLWSGDVATGRFDPVPRVPANDYYRVWALSEKAFVATDAIGRLIRFDDGQWTVTPTGLNEPVSRFAASADGTVFAISQTTFGRYTGTAFEAIPVDAPGDQPYQLLDLAVNSPNEVFLAVQGENPGAPSCGYVFVIWYDGNAFHQL